MSDREYPNVSFVDTDTSALMDSFILSYEQFTGRKLYPADPVRLFILWIVDIIIQERTIINNAARQNVPRFATGEYLDSLGEIFRDVYRKEAQPATATFRFTLSSPQTDRQLIPIGTRVSVDGDITFETTANLYIEPGERTGEVSGVCQVPGSIGNDFLPGQIIRIVDVFPFFESVENITASEGGAEEENDDEFYNRMRGSMESYSTAGPTGAYEYFAKLVSTDIADAKATSPEPGVVDVRILLKNGALPGTEILKAVDAALSDEKIRPLTDSVTVSAPETIDFYVDVAYYISTPNADSAAVIAQSVTEAVEQYVAWQTGVLGRDINPDYLRYLLMGTGIKRVDIFSPSFIIIQENHVARHTGSHISIGGTEDE